MLEHLRVVSGKTVLLNVVHLDISRKRLHSLAENDMDVALQLSRIVLDQIGLKVTIGVLSRRNNGNVVGTIRSERGSCLLPRSGVSVTRSG